MKLVPIFIFVIAAFWLATLCAAPPESLRAAAENADGVVVGLLKGHGTGAFPYMDFSVLEVLKGKQPDGDFGVVFPPETVSDIDLFEVLRAHGSVYIIPYKLQKDENGRYAYAGPRLDSEDIIASRANIETLKPDSSLFNIPSFEEALTQADVAAVVIPDYSKFEGEGNTRSFNIQEGYFFYVVHDVLKGYLPETNITVTLRGKYLYWLFFGGGFTKKGQPLISDNEKILLLKKADGKLYYAGPEFTTPRLSATLKNITETRRMIQSQRQSPQVKTDFSWTWWIIGTAAAIVAFIAALVISKIDYKYDRRRERLEKLRSGSGSDSGSDSSGAK